MKTAIRILIVDDRAPSRKALKRSFLPYECRFEEASTAAAALRLMAANEFDISFIDLRLPDMSGINVLTIARNRRWRIGLPVIVTGEPKPTTAEEAERLGAKFLTKPLQLGDVRAALHEAVPAAVATPASFTLPEKLGNPEPAAQRPRVLVLDDSEDFLKRMESALGNEFHLDATTRPEEAIKAVTENDYELIILDMKLPGTTGLDMLRRMREFAPDVHAIILTGYEGYDEETHLDHATKAGQLAALRYVKKGPNVAEKIRRIHAENPRETRVFFCYAHADRRQVAEYYNRLTRRGFRVFRDEEDIHGGKDWALTISDAIENADRFVYFLSQNSYNRKGDMRDEINKALLRQNKFIKNSTFFIPARLEACGIEKDIKQFQAVDLFMENGFARLLVALTTD